MAHQKPTQLPPQNKEAEVCLLGSLMIDVNAIVRVADFLLIEDFYYPEHQKIYQAMLDLFQRNTPIDVISVSNTLKEKDQLNDIGGQAYLSELVSSVPTASNVANYASIVQKKRVLRDLISASHEIEAIARNEAEDSDVLLDRAERHIFGIAQKSFTQRFHPLREGLEKTFERIDQLSKHKGGLRGLPSGFTKLDNTLAGLQKSDLIILAARPSMGKSALALDIARNVAVFDKTPVGIFSLEMSQDQVIDRMLAGQANVDLWKLRTGRLSEKGEQNDFARIQAALGILSEAPIFIDDSSGINILQMRAMARRLQSNYGLGLLVIDYLQLMSPMNSMHSMVQQVTENSRALKGLAKELNIPVLVLSQLSRAVEQRTPHRPRLSDLRESGCLTGDALITNAKTGERVAIKDIAEGKRDPFPVWAVDDGYKVKPHQMIKAFYSGKKQVFELRTRSGRAIKASGNHPFLRKDGWSPLEELKEGEFIALPGPIIEAKSSVATNDKENAPNYHIFWDQIVSIIPKGVEDVYDATVEDVHNFVANDIIVHNSIEQDADVVMFIYREDFYKENPSQENVADIIIAKHRNGPVGQVSLYFDGPRVTFRNLEEGSFDKQDAF